MTKTFKFNVRNEGSEFNGISEEPYNIQFYQPRGCLRYSTVLIRFALLLRYNSS